MIDHQRNAAYFELKIITNLIMWNRDLNEVAAKCQISINKLRNYQNHYYTKTKIILDKSAHHDLENVEGLIHNREIIKIIAILNMKK